MGFQVIDTPGNLINTGRASEFYFKKPDCVIICMDISLQLDENKINVWTEWVMTQISKYHRDFNQNMVELNDPAKKGYEQKNVTGPLIMHVFTKHDKIPEVTQERNDRVLKQMQRRGYIGNYTHVSTLTGEGLE